jgi:hypothetical protein
MSHLAVWSVVFQLYAGMPRLHEHMIFPADAGCLDYCIAYVRETNAWAVSQGLSTELGRAGTCACVIERECARADCRGEKLFSDLLPNP